MFGGDPFGDPFGNMFGGMHQQMRRQMRDMDRMMNSMMDPFNVFGNQQAFGGMLEDGMQRQQPVNNSLSVMNDFGFGGNLFGGLMRQMEGVQAAALNDPNAHVFSQSTMISYDGARGGQPRVVEKSVRKTGDVKETRSSVRQGEGGVGDKMSIEHTIGNRTHVIEKKRDREGRLREQQHFVNLHEGEAEDFDREFSTRVRRNMGGTTRGNRRAIEGRGGSTSNSKLFNESRDQRKLHAANAPIVTLPEDETEDTDTNNRRQRTTPNRPSSSHSSRSQNNGPIIREVDEEEEQQHRDTKRRKGVLGRLFKANDE